MVTTFGSSGAGGIDRLKLRLAIIAVLVIAAFVALFSRLWFLQVLASEDYERFAQENRVRFVYSEPSRGRILDVQGRTIVRNRGSNSVTIDRQIVSTPRRERKVLRRLSKLLEIPVGDLRNRLNDATVSPYKPVAVANDVSERDSIYISEHAEDFRGVITEVLPIRYYPQGNLAGHALGYVGEISPEELESGHFKDVVPAYAPGDLVGKDGLEYFYDRFIRGRPEINKMIVNSSNDVVGAEKVQDERPGRDLILSLDLDVQKLTEKSLKAGLRAARAHYNAPAGAAVVMDPTTGGIVAMASFPGYDPSILADGITTKEYEALGAKTPNDPDDDALLNRGTQAMRKPGSSFKAVTAGAALASGVADAYTHLDCPGARVYPPNGGTGSVTFHNWTSASRGSTDFPASLEHSCNTFYYELGWRMETAYGAALGDGTERFQRYARKAGLGDPTGVDLRYEASGLVPDERWCKARLEATKDTRSPTCKFGWLPGYTVNMSIGQGDLLVTPLQMAVTYGAIANGGNVMRPRFGWGLARPVGTDEERTVREFKPRVVAKLHLEDSEMAVIQQGLKDVIAGGSGTARGVFSGFPLERFPLAGKTGTAQLGDTGLNDAWFVSYGPTDDLQYVISVYVEEAGHGGTSAAPIARQIWEGILGIDNRAEVRLGSDSSG